MTIIVLLSTLSTYQFIDVCNKFRFLIIDILNNLTNGVVIYMLFVLLISLTGYASIIFNWKLLNPSVRIFQSELIDDVEMKGPHRFWILFYLSFGVLVVGLGAFLIILSIQQYVAMNRLLEFLLPIIIAAILIGLGMMFIIDGIKIRRLIKSPQSPDKTSSF